MINGTQIEVMRRTSAAVSKLRCAWILRGRRLPAQVDAVKISLRCQRRRWRADHSHCGLNATLINGKAIPACAAEIRSPNLLTVQVGADRDTLQSALARGAELTFQPAGAAQARIDLAGADEAIKALNACVK